MNPLRETPNFVATAAKRGVRIAAKEKGATPKSLVVSRRLWLQLERMSDSEFDGSVVLEIGVGAFRSHRK